ncbi:MULTISPECIES: FKBP-type peptidyl-prolyl cis-trans isomerase [Gordonia]|uniref:Peptidyl-prolyl cis-trans isomerase n=1 Tax=Gordonia tangerina TaxID=2911060 RepID=A0ABS9DQ27_9ACTN|nr:FKBP-type peptidyl-prolyl cis-trans isomerase [Gordonia tangerina]MCF3941330.1 FKBP-type peptidyl-prolyl cis-trans isomerase [Gordonia tangerina]
MFTVRRAALASTLLLTLALSACNSTDDTAAESSGQAAASTVAVTTCPSSTPDASATPAWEFDGATGAIAVTAPTEDAAPAVEVTTPFSVDETTVQTLVPASGAIVEDTATVSVCYLGVNGRDGSVFDSSYERGTPAEFPLDGVVTGFQKAIAGQNVGAAVAVAMTSADGYPEGNPQAGIEQGDTLVFVIQILGAEG